jgi:uncharacterized protein (TIGR02266 family)
LAPRPAGQRRDFRRESVALAASQSSRFKFSPISAAFIYMPTPSSSAPPKVREPVEEATFTDAPVSGVDGRRAYARVAVDLDVSLASEHNFYAGFAENLSAGGIFVATHKLLPVGEEIGLTIRLPGIQEPVLGVGEVRWVREYSERSNVAPGLGLRFVHLAPGCAALVARFLEHRDPIFFDD